MTTPASTHDGGCIDGGINTTLRVRVPPGEGTDFSWPPLPQVGSAALDFVLKNAFIALAPGCVTPSGVAPNADNGPGTPKNLWVGRVDGLSLPLALDKCGCGAAIFVGGSGGNTGDNLRMMRHLAASGYSTISADTMGGARAGSAGAYPRHRDATPDLAHSIGAHDSYWCANDAYASGCKDNTAGGSYPACFTSNAAHIRYDSAGWAAFYERVYTLRKRELDTIVESFVTSFGQPQRLFLHGNSEGAMAASRYSHNLLPSLNLKGRILTAWSCEYNYFVSCRQHAAIGTPTVPILNLISNSDEFFASTNSVASAVAAPGPGAYGDQPTGSCARQMRQQGVPGASIKLLEPYHDALEEMGSLYRLLVTRFLNEPTLFASSGILSFRGVSLPNTLCDNERMDAGVLSASCRSLQEYVTPQPHERFNATTCGWASELVRPSFVDMRDSMPPTCAAAAPSAGGSKLALHLFLGALLGVCICSVIGFIGIKYAQRKHGLQLFVRLKDEREQTGDERGNEVMSPAASPPYQLDAT